jgi:hypothetical protein
MSKIEKFSNFTYEGLASTGAKMRRIVTGQSAGDEIEKLSVDQQNKLMSLYRQDPMEAAKYLRSIIIREKNSQFGLGLALTLAGAAMIYKAAHVEPPTPKPDPKGEWVKFKAGEGETQFLQREFGIKCGPNDSLSNYTDGIAKHLGNGNYEEGCKNLVAGLKPGAEHDEILSNLLKLKGMDQSLPLKDVFVGDLSPHQGLAWGDLGGKVFVPDAAPHIYVTPDTIN